MEYVACRKKRYNKVPVAVCLEKCSEEDRARCKAFKRLDEEVVKQIMEERGMGKEDVLEGCIEMEEEEGNDTGVLVSEDAEIGDGQAAVGQDVKAKESADDEVIRIGEIKRLHKKVEASMAKAVETARSVVEDSIRIGELLTEAKKKVKHGEWLAWIEGNMPFSQPTASRYIKLFENRSQIIHTLQTVNNLSLRGALQLLTAREEEPEEKAAKPEPENKTPKKEEKPKKEEVKHVEAEVVEPEPEAQSQEELLEKVSKLTEENEILKQELLKRKPPDPQKSEPKIPEKEKDPKKAGEKLTFCQIGDTKFGLYEEQYNDVMEAIEKAMIIAESDRVGHCLSMICVEFNVMYPGVGPEENDEEANTIRIKSAIELAKRMEAMYLVKIPQLIDEKTGEVYE